DGTIITANRNFLAVTGYRLEQIQGKHHTMFCDDSFYREHPDFWASLAAGRFSSGRFHRRRSDGSDLWLEASYNPVLDDKGWVENVLDLASDITERVEPSRQNQDATAVASAAATQTVNMVGRADEALRQSKSTALQIEQCVDKAKSIIAEFNERSKRIERMV